MQTIPSYDLQQVPANYDTEDYNFEVAPVLVPCNVFSHGNTVIVNLNGSPTDELMLRLQGFLDEQTKAFLNEEYEKEQNLFYGF